MLTFKKAKKGIENKFIEKFLENELEKIFNTSKDIIVFEEPSIDTGFRDIVIIIFDKNNLIIFIMKVINYFSKILKKN